MCQKIGCVVSNLLYFSEKLAVWMAGVSLVGCIIITLVLMLALGIGLGYNYCYVDYQTRSRYRFIPPHYQTMPPPKKNRRFGDNDTAIVMRTVPQKSLTVTSLPPILKANFENTTITYFDPPSTKPVFEKTNLWTKIIYNINVTEKQTTEKRTTKIVTRYKFWAVPYNSTSKHATNKAAVKGTNTTFVKPTRTTPSGLAVENPINSKPTRTTLVDDPDNSTEELVEVVSEANSINATQNKRVLSISGLDLLALLSQLRAENRNYSLQIVTS